MEWPEGYEIGLYREIQKGHYPNLKEGENFEFTSYRTDMPEFHNGQTYNCVAYALGEKEWLEMNRFIDMFKLSPPYDDSAMGYGRIFEKHYGFEFCEDCTVERGYEKVAIYELDGEFQHIARLKEDGRWTTKFGDFEDIEHNELKDVSGGWYGTPKVFMKRKRAPLTLLLPTLLRSLRSYLFPSFFRQ